MGSIICIANQKGGTSKSTIAFNLASVLPANNKIFVIDADPQATISRWAKIRASSGNINQNIKFSENPWDADDILNTSQTNNYDIVIIDCPPANNKIIKASLVVSDLIIIPISPSPLDIDSAFKTIELIEEGINKGVCKAKAYLLISKKITGTNLAKEVRKTCQILKLPILKSEISQRVVLCESPIKGQSIIEYAPHSVSAKEFLALGKEVIKCLKQN